MNEVEVEDPDEFEEEELMILEDLPDHDIDIDNEVTGSNSHENGQQQDVGYADEDYCDGDSSEAASEEEDEEGDGEDEAFYEDNDFDGEFFPCRILCCIFCKPFLFILQWIL